MVDVTDSKSVGLIPRVGSSPTTGTTPLILNESGAFFFLYGYRLSSAKHEM